MAEHERSILDEIRFHRLTGDEGAAPIEWRAVAAVLAEELDVLAMRLAGSPGISEADEERVARAACALRQYRSACTEHDES